MITVRESHQMAFYFKRWQFFWCGCWTLCLPVFIPWSNASLWWVLAAQAWGTFIKHIDSACAYFIILLSSTRQHESTRDPNRNRVHLTTCSYHLTVRIACSCNTGKWHRYMQELIPCTIRFRSGKNITIKKWSIESRKKVYVFVMNQYSCIEEKLPANKVIMWCFLLLSICSNA